MKNFILLPLFLFFINSCATKSKAYAPIHETERTLSGADLENRNSQDRTFYDLAFYKDKVGETEDLSFASSNDNRLITYDAFVTLTLKNRDSIMQDLERLAKFHGGYLASYSDRQVVLKVQNDRLNLAMKQLKVYGEISNSSLKAQDITGIYRDLEIELENTEKARQRYLELFEQAKSATEMLLIEKELERVNGQINRLKGQLNTYNNKLQYASITIALTNKVKPGILGYVGIGIFKSIKWFFVR